MEKTYDAGIIGGGLAGLATSIELAKQGHKVILWEKKSYPYHKVCGEYISMESWNYLKSLGVQLEEMQLPKINQLLISTPSGLCLEQELGLGGFGISRYTLDAQLAELAKAAGVELLENCKVEEVRFQEDYHLVSTAKENYKATLVLGAYGKRSLLDKKWNRSFIQNPLERNKNFTAVKYHVEADLPENLIGLHIFNGGYCGISKVEGKNRYCLCYLTLASKIQANGSIEALEKEVLSKNKRLKEYLTFSRLYKKPEVISQVNFKRKSQIEDHVFMLGDTAGLIVPLCGNGMSMALHSAHIFSKLAELYFNQQLNRAELEMSYKNLWNKEFSLRIKVGRLLQTIFYRTSLNQPLIKILKVIPTLTQQLIKLTHGKPFA